MSRYTAKEAERLLSVSGCDHLWNADTPDKTITEETTMSRKTPEEMGCRPSVAFGVQAPNAVCAVEGCFQQGKPQICPHDGKFHNHGMVHYRGDYPQHSLTFRRGWHLICDEHYEIVRRERKEWEEEKDKGGP